MVAPWTTRCVSVVLKNPQELLAAQCAREINVPESYINKADLQKGMIGVLE